MKNIIYIIPLLLLFNCQTRTENDIEAFNKFLGPEKAKVFNYTVQSFQEFLVLNYPDRSDENQRISEFLNTLSNSPDSHINFILDKEKCRAIINRWEESGLRKEVWLHLNEEYQSGQKDSAKEVLPYTRTEEIVDTINYSNCMEFNTIGLFLNGLANYAQHDTIIQGYVDGKSALGTISYVSVAEGFKKLNIQYNEPFFMRILVVEFYYDLIKSAIEKEDSGLH